MEAPEVAWEGEEDAGGRTEGGEQEEGGKGKEGGKEGECVTHSSPALHCHCRLLKPISVSVHVDACVESV